MSRRPTWSRRSMATSADVGSRWQGPPGDTDLTVIVSGLPHRRGTKRLRGALTVLTTERSHGGAVDRSDRGSPTPSSRSRGRGSHSRRRSTSAPTLRPRIDCREAWIAWTTLHDTDGSRVVERELGAFQQDGRQFQLASTGPCSRREHENDPLASAPAQCKRTTWKLCYHPVVIA
jgi:hypothetical protein